MIPRNRFLITAALLCHSLLGPPLVTSQLRSPVLAAPGQKTGPLKPAPSAPCGSRSQSQAGGKSTDETKGEDNNDTTICSLQQEKDGPIYKLHQQVEIDYGSYILHADEVTYNSDTGQATAEGHFTLDGGPNDDHIKASHATYNLTAESGRFYDVIGTTGLLFRGSRAVLTSTAPFAFTGKIVEKTDSTHYLVYDGTITTCELPQPKWQFNARKVVVDVGGNAKIYHSKFLLDGFPVFYFPFATHPVEREARETGFLVPSVGRSSTKGNTVGDSFYWAINRSADATIGGEYFSQRGWSQRGEFRARPSDTSYIDLNYFGVIDRENQGGENARLNAQGNFYGFRSVANIDYLSSFLFRLVFNEIFTQAVNSEVKSQAFLAKSMNGFSISGMVERYQNFVLVPNEQLSSTTTPEQVVTISHAPSLDLSSVDRQLWRSPFYWSFDASLGGLARSEPGFRTGNLLGRFDLDPQIALPLLFKGWSLRPELTLHGTYYTERLVQSNGVSFAQNNPISRQALETAVELRPPALERVFDKEFLGRKWKHVIEPLAVYRFVTGVNNFPGILHFDERDILSDTHEVEYGFVTRLYTKRTTARAEDCNPDMRALMVGGPAPEQSIPWQRANILQTAPCTPGPGTREVATWEIAQKYFLDPTFGGALIAGLRNVFSSTEDLTGIAFATQQRHLSPIVSRLRVKTSDRTDIEWDLDYDFQLDRINASTLLANYHVGPFTFGGGDASLQIPSTADSSTAATQKFQQFRIALGYGQPYKRGLSAASSFGIDAQAGQLQFATAQTSYSWDCCGMTVEYRRYAIANVRNENVFRFTFSLANIGSFGNLRRQERLY